MTTREQIVWDYYHANQQRVDTFYYPFIEEAALQKKVIEMCEIMGGLVVREAYATKRGISDLLVCYNGSFVALELKDDQGKPSPQQLKFIAKVVKAGGRAAVVRTLSQAFDLLCGRQVV